MQNQETGDRAIPVPFYNIGDVHDICQKLKLLFELTIENYRHTPLSYENLLNIRDEEARKLRDILLEVKLPGSLLNVGLRNDRISDFMKSVPQAERGDSKKVLMDLKEQLIGMSVTGMDLVDRFERNRVLSVRRECWYGLQSLTYEKPR